MLLPSTHCIDLFIDLTHPRGAQARRGSVLSAAILVGGAAELSEDIPVEWLTEQRRIPTYQGVRPVPPAHFQQLLSHFRGESMPKVGCGDTCDYVVVAYVSRHYCASADNGSMPYLHTGHDGGLTSYRDVRPYVDRLMMRFCLVATVEPETLHIWESMVRDPLFGWR